MKSPDQRSGNAESSRIQSAFSLIEILITVSIIVLMSLIFIPQISKMHETSTESRDRRNAQHIVTVFSSAQAAGLDFFVTGDKAATISAAVTGATVTEGGPFYRAYFGMPGITEESQLKAANYLAMDEEDRTLVYLTKGSN